MQDVVIAKKRTHIPKFHEVGPYVRANVYIASKIAPKGQPIPTTPESKVYIYAPGLNHKRCASSVNKHFVIVLHVFVRPLSWMISTRAAFSLSILSFTLCLSLSLPPSLSLSLSLCLSLSLSLSFFLSLFLSFSLSLSSSFCPLHS